MAPAEVEVSRSGEETEQKKVYLGKTEQIKQDGIEVEIVCQDDRTGVEFSGTNLYFATGDNQRTFLSEGSFARGKVFVYLTKEKDSVVIRNRGKKNNGRVKVVHTFNNGLTGEAQELPVPQKEPSDKYDPGTNPTEW